MDTAVAFPFKAALVLLMAATTCSLYCKQHPLGLGKQHRCRWRGKHGGHHSGDAWAGEGALETIRSPTPLLAPLISASRPV